MRTGMAWLIALLLCAGEAAWAQSEPAGGARVTPVPAPISDPDNIIAPGTVAPTESPAAAAKPGQDAVIDRLRAAGYDHVTDLEVTWTGTAMKNGEAVRFRLADDGTITDQPAAAE